MVQSNLPFRIKVITLTTDMLEHYNKSSFHRSELLFATQDIHLTISDKPLLIKSHHVVVIPSNLSRKMTIGDGVESHKKIGYIFSLSEKYLNAISNDFVETPMIKTMMSEPNIFYYSAVSWQQMSFLLNKLVKDVPKATTVIEQKIVFTTATQLLLEAYRLNGAIADESSQLDERQKLALDIKHYIEDHFIDDILLEDIEKLFNISASTANRIFQQYFHSTIHQFIIELRLGYAHQCIIGGFSITQSWQKSGFNDYSNFYRSFIKHYDYRPNDIKPHEYQ